MKKHAETAGSDQQTAQASAGVTQQGDRPCAKTKHAPVSEKDPQIIRPDYKEIRKALSKVKRGILRRGKRASLTSVSKKAQASIKDAIDIVSRWSKSFDVLQMTEETLYLTKEALKEGVTEKTLIESAENMDACKDDICYLESKLAKDHERKQTILQRVERSRARAKLKTMHPVDDNGEEKDVEVEVVMDYPNTHVKGITFEVSENNEVLWSSSNSHKWAIGIDINYVLRWFEKNMEVNCATLYTSCGQEITLDKE